MALTSWLRSLKDCLATQAGTRNRWRPKARKEPTQFRPCLEVLENRLAPASLTLTSGSYFAYTQQSTMNDGFWLTPGTTIPFHDLSVTDQTGSNASFTASNFTLISDTEVNLGSSGSITSTGYAANGLHNLGAVQPSVYGLQVTITPDGTAENNGDPVDAAFTLTASASAAMANPFESPGAVATASVAGTLPGTSATAQASASGTMTSSPPPTTLSIHSTIGSSFAIAITVQAEEIGNAGTASGQATLSYQIGPAKKDHLVVTVQPTTSVLAGQQFDVKVSAEDANGKVDTNFTDDVTMALISNPGSSTLGGTTTVKAVGGVADFGDLTLNHAGQGYTLQATSSNADSATTSPFDVTDKLVVTAQPPASVLAGDMFDVKVSAEDVNGQVDTNFTGNVTMALGSNPGNSTLGGTLTVSANAGVADFGDLTLNHAGQGYTLTATTNNASPATTNPFNVMDKLVVTIQPQPPNSVLAGDEFDVKTSAVDANGTLDTNFTDNVTMALANNPGGSALGGTTTVKAVGGTADFDDLTLDQPGQGYTLTATSNAVMPVTTSPFDVASITATSLQWHTNSTDGGGVDLTYTVNGSALPQGTTLALYWADGTDFLTANTQPVFSAPVVNTVGQHALHVTADQPNQLGTPMAGTQDLIFVVDPGNVSQANEADTTQYLPASPGAILANSVKVVTAGPLIDGFFQPAGGALTLDQGAAIVGINHFNWLQEVILQPNQWKVRNVTTGQIETLPRADPQVSDLTIFDPAAVPPTPISVISALGDGSNFYWKENPAEWKIYSTTFSLEFRDAPAYAASLFAAPNSPPYVQFSTSLAGVDANGLPVLLTPGIGDGFTWKTNSAIAFNVAYFKNPDSTILPPITSGGVFGVTYDNQTAITNVTSTLPNGSYKFGTMVPIQVSFSQLVTVTGTPGLALNSGGTANYTGGSGTATLTFSYTVAAGQNANPLDEASVNALALNGGSIVDGSGNAATLTLPAPATPGSLGANKSIVIDTVAPAVVDFLVLFGNQSYSLVSNAGTLSNRQDLPWEITGIEVVFSKVINSADPNSLTGITATGIGGLGTNTLTWTFAQLPTSSLPYTLGLKTIGADGIQDLAANFLASGANNSQSFKVLIGDVNGDGKVNASDLQLVKNAMSAAYNVFADFNGDGAVDLNDYNICRANLNKHL
jgi:hypothetical protein